MNNMAMQKLVNLYQFIDEDAFENCTKNPYDPNTKKVLEWQKQCTMPRHIYEKVQDLMTIYQEYIQLNENWSRFPGQAIESKHNLHFQVGELIGIYWNLNEHI